MKFRKTLLIITLVFLFFCSLGITAKATINNPIDNIFASPGEDASTEVGISWHSLSSVSTLVYTEASDTSFQMATRIECYGTLNTATYEYSDIGAFYIFNVDLTDLVPDTKFMYRIQTSTALSGIQYFKTAGFGGQFNFMVLSDVHAGKDSTHFSNDGTTETGSLKRLIQAGEGFAEEAGGVDTIIWDGDFVNFGNMYSQWQMYNNSYLSSNYSIALTNGNHEYKHSKQGNIGYTEVSHKWAETMFNNPNNGSSKYPYSYWFLYNNVLFLAFDDIGENSDEARTWMEQAILKNEGRYQYIVVYHHYPDFTVSGSSTSPCDYGNYDLHDLWDKYGVDIVISADSHDYLRTYPMYENKVSTNKSKGTVYVTTTAINTGNVAVKESTKGYAKECTGSAVGGLLFYVTPQTMTMKLFNTTSGNVDSYVFEARRELSLSDSLRKSVEENIEYINVENSTDGYVELPQLASSIVSNVKIFDGTTELGEASPVSTRVTAIKVENLAQNQVKTLNALIVYTDGSNSTVPILVNTMSYPGYISNFNAGIQNDNIILSWEENDLSDDVSKIKLYRNEDDFIGEIDKNVKTFSFEKQDRDSNATYYLVLVDSIGNVLKKYRTKYLAFGDLNFDGTVNVVDMDLVSNYIFTSENFARDLESADIDKDGFTTYKDLMLIWYSIANETSLNTDSYVVTFKNIDGSVISRQLVKYGESATAPLNPSMEGYTFFGWSDGFSNITEATEIYAIYSK